jgi:hypothetical protein
VQSRLVQYPSSILYEFSFPLARTEAEFKEEYEVRDLILELTITSPYIMVDSEVQLSIVATTNVFSSIQKRKMEQPIGKGEYTVRTGWELI